mgnify:CR=1 FL=1
MAEEVKKAPKPVDVNSAKYKLGKIAADAYVDAIEAKKRGEKVAWVSSNFPVEIPETMGIATVYPENQAAGIAARGEDGFAVFNGPDEQFVSGRVIGADGGIGGTYAVMPELYLAMNEHINKGEIEAARAIQYDADRIIYKMCEAHGNLYAVQKEILRRMYGLELGGVREPMPGLIPEDEPIVAEAQAMIEAAIAKL